jgi:signal transduction histidine kinase
MDVTQKTGTRKRQGFFNIRTKLIFYFSAMIIVIFVAKEASDELGIPFTRYTGHYRDETNATFKKLSLIADLKRDLVQRWLNERREDVTWFAENDMLGTAIAHMRADWRRLSAEGAQGPELWTLLRRENTYQHLQRYIEAALGFHAIWKSIQIADAETGVILASNREWEQGISMAQDPVFQAALDSPELYIKDIHMNLYTGQPTLEFSQRIRGVSATPAEKPDRIEAVVVMSLNSASILGPLLNTGEGLGRTGEVVLVSRNAAILTPLKNPLPDGSRLLPLQFVNPAEPAKLAAEGHECVIESKDYENHAVLAACRSVRVTPQIRWGMVVKCDQAEIFAPIRRQLALSMIVGATGILIAVGVMVFLAKTLTRPIAVLTAAAEKVTQGDFDATIPNHSHGELGLLTTAFNTMLQKVRNWNGELREQVRKQTKNLNQLIEDLRSEIGRRRQAQRQRELLIDELKTRNAELKHFNVAVSHDLRSPLITIRGYVEFLEKDLAEGRGDQARGDISRIANAAEKMEQLLKDLLKFSAIDSQKLETVPVSMATVAQEVAGLLAGSIHERKVRIETAGELPTVYGVHSQLVELFQNLMENAIKYMGDQTEPRVEIGAVKEPDKTIFYIRDNGIGVDPVHHDKIFGIFEKLDRTTAGSGIGLALSRRIVEKHGGRIWVESRPPQSGSTFYFTIPNPLKGENHEYAI